MVPDTPSHLQLYAYQRSLSHEGYSALVALGGALTRTRQLRHSTLDHALAPRDGADAAGCAQCHPQSFTRKAGIYMHDKHIHARTHGHVYVSCTCTRTRTRTRTRGGTHPCTQPRKEKARMHIGMLGTPISLFAGVRYTLLGRQSAYTNICAWSMRPGFDRRHSWVSSVLASRPWWEAAAG